MQWLFNNPEGARTVASIISSAGGKVVGRTRLQKMFYLLDVAGYSDAFHFEYRHYGPFSDELAQAASTACITGLISEEEYSATWGGTYSVFLSNQPAAQLADDGEKRLLEIANDANPIDLELAATAIFLAKAGDPDPWGETMKRKPEKAKRIADAKQLVSRLRQLQVKVPFPTL